ncbi:MAG TPA: cytochrome P450 [Polyangiaceae bacterium]|nr:cytochrome P450 [Polyangiaceae bacterium]
MTTPAPNHPNGEPAPEPPGPQGLLEGIRLLHRLRANLAEHMARLARDHGDAVRYSVASLPVYQFSHPDAAIEILSSKHHAFRKPVLLRRVLGQWNGNGLVVNEGEPWVKQRRLVNPAFKPQRVQKHAAEVVRRANAMLDGWRGRRETDASEDLARLTLGVVAEALFGSEVDHRIDAFITHVATLNQDGFNEVSSPILLPMWAPTPAKRRIRAATEFLQGTADEFIAAWRRSGEDHGDLLSMMLLAKDEEGNGGQMNDRQARDEAINLLLGGNETTATGLTWAVYLLAKHPDVQEEARKEVIEALGDAPPTAESAPRLKLTEMIFKEALRLYPPVYIVPREAKEDVVIGGYRVKRGATVHVASFVIQRDARWFEDPLTFRPRRFEAEETFRRGAFLPFGAGPRACIGRGFAMMEGTLALACLLKRFRVGLPDPSKEAEMEAQVSLHPKGGLRVTLHEIGG